VMEGRAALFAPGTLDEASRIDLRFPYDIYAKPIAQTSCYGGLRDQILA
jgi:hypothetical protein